MTHLRNDHAASPGARTLRGLVVLLVLLGVTGAAFAGGLPEADAPTLKALRVNLGLNRVDGPPSVVKKLHEAWQEGRRHGFRLVHLGDSHLQIGIVAEALRSALQNDLGAGGYGLVFPYSLDGTYSPAGYSSQHEGAWRCTNARRPHAEIPYGVMGTACRTSQDGAAFTLAFTRDLDPSWRSLRLYCQRQDRPFSLEVTSDGATVSVPVEPASIETLPYVRVTLPRVGRTLGVRFRQPPGEPTEFEIHGVAVDSVEFGGAVVYSGGVGGAQYEAPLRGKLFASTLTTLDPQVVVIDYGTNDYLYTDTIEPTVEGTIRKVVALVRQAAPTAVIVLTSAQDLYWKKRPVRSGAAFSTLVKRVAREEGCAFYDWFWIAGGPQSVKAWEDQGFARKDRVHLTDRGYRLKGALLARALREAGATRPNPAPKRPRHR